MDGQSLIEMDKVGARAKVELNFGHAKFKLLLGCSGGNVE